MQQFNDDAIQRIRETVRAHESRPLGVPSQFRGLPPPAPKEFMVGRADETIAPTTDPLTSGDINSGTVSIYRWNPDSEQWEDTEENVEAYDFSGVGCAANDWLQLHRLAHGGGVLWVLGGLATGRFIATISGTEHTCTTNGTVTTSEIENTAPSTFSFSSSNLTLPLAGRYMFYLTSTLFANTAGNWNASVGWLRNGGEWRGGITTFYGNSAVVGTPMTLAVPLYDHTAGDYYTLWMSQSGATSVIMFGNTPGGGGAGQAMRWTVERKP